MKYANTFCLYVFHLRVIFVFCFFVFFLFVCVCVCVCVCVLGFFLRLYVCNSRCTNNTLTQFKNTFLQKKKLKNKTKITKRMSIFSKKSNAHMRTHTKHNKKKQKKTKKSFCCKRIRTAVIVLICQKIWKNMKYLTIGIYCMGLKL